MTETNTTAMYRKVMRAAKSRLGSDRYQADFEHGQWWITRLKDGAQWSVVDCQAGIGGVKYLDFEQVTCGEVD
jgi:hypothetical protein